MRAVVQVLVLAVLVLVVVAAAFRFASEWLVTVATESQDQVVESFRPLDYPELEFGTFRPYAP